MSTAVGSLTSVTAFKAAANTNCKPATHRIALFPKSSRDETRHVLWTALDAGDKHLPAEKVVNPQANSACQRQRDQCDLDHELVIRHSRTVNQPYDGRKHDNYPTHELNCWRNVAK